MSTVSVKLFAHWRPVNVDEAGRPLCFCGCGQLMVEVAPNAYQCPDGYAVEKAVGESLRSFLQEVDAAAEAGRFWSTTNVRPQHPLELLPDGQRATPGRGALLPPVDWDAIPRLLGSDRRPA